LDEGVGLAEYEEFSKEVFFCDGVKIHGRLDEFPGGNGWLDDFLWDGFPSGRMDDPCGIG